MSMLSAQVDELRSMAESVGLAMPQAATLMMGAADTIWELRCKCAGMVDMRERARLAETENAKLRELVDGLEYCVQGLVCDCCPLYDPSGTNHRRCESLERELGIEAEQ